MHLVSTIIWSDRQVSDNILLITGKELFDKQTDRTEYTLLSDLLWYQQVQQFDRVTAYMLKHTALGNAR